VIEEQVNIGILAGFVACGRTEQMIKNEMDPLRSFSEACRKELLRFVF
jgi:hypothetical protein